MIKSQNPKQFRIWSLHFRYCFEFRDSNFGFTLLELMLVVAITAVLSGMVTFSFRAQREQQELQGAGSDFISKLREKQSAIYGGKEVSSGVAPDAYEIVVNSGGSSYDIYYILIDRLTKAETRSFLENVKLPERVTFGSGATIRFESPFGKIKINGSANQAASIILSHKSGRTRSVRVDGVSGRIGVE